MQNPDLPEKNISVLALCRDGDILIQVLKGLIT